MAKQSPTTQSTPRHRQQGATKVADPELSGMLLILTLALITVLAALFM